MLKYIKIEKFYLFLIVITTLKIIFMGIFSSDYQNEMFMPFVTIFIENIFNVNPYEYYYINNLKPSFPYPPLMLIIESIGGLAVYFFSNAPLFLKNVFFKLPNLFFDFLLLYYLMKLYPHKRKYIGILYFASPILLYSTYMHGQLDIIPTAFLIGAIYYLTGKSGDKLRNIMFIVMLTGALSTKLHILAVLPVLLIYIFKKNRFETAIKLMSIPILLTAIVILPFLSKGFLGNVVFNSEQQVLIQVFLEFNELRLYIPIIVILFIYLIEFGLNSINKDLLISLCGLLFLVFLALVPPMPGWYVWIIPFITIFFISVNENKYKNLIIYLFLNSFYIIYFIFFHKTENVDLYFYNIDLSFLKIDNDTLRNIIFTILSGLLIYSIASMYKLGIESNTFYKRKNLPFTIGIAGDSGSGKSTFIDIIETCLDKDDLLYIEGDGDHKWERGEEMWNYYTHLNPKANFLYKQAKDISTLRTGAKVKRVDYDHKTGKFTNEYIVKPKKYIIICGLHSLYLPQMRKCLDFKIYMDSDETLRRYWKIQRDISTRGYTKEKILHQIESRMPDAIKYIVPQKQYADLVIQYFDKNLKDCCIENHNVVISLKFTLNANINLEILIQELQKYNISIQYDYSSDLNKQSIVFDGDTLQNIYIPFDDIANNIIPQIDEITKQNLNTDNNLNGIIKLIILIMISDKMQVGGGV